MVCVEKKEGWETGREEVKKEAGERGRKKEKRKEYVYTYIYITCVCVYKNTHISCIKYMYYRVYM